MAVRTLLASGVLGVVLLACSPDIPDGVFTCSDDSECPAGLSCDEGLCFKGRHLGVRDAGANHQGGAAGDDEPSDAGGAGDSGTSSTGNPGTGGSGSGGAGGAGGGRPPLFGGGTGGSAGAGAGGAGSGATGGTPGPITYETCDDENPCAGDFICARGPDMQAAHGTCSIQCASDGDCPDADGVPGVCVASACLHGCDSTDDCEAPLACHKAATAPMEWTVACFEVSDPNLLGTRTCNPTTMGSCGGGAGCAFAPMLDPDGVCSFLCDAESAPCPGGGDCIEVFPQLQQCFKPCTDTAQCGDLTCQVFGEDVFGAGSKHCVPPNWAGHSLPLTPPMM